MTLAGQALADESLRVYAAGSLNAAMTDIAASFAGNDITGFVCWAR